MKDKLTVTRLVLAVISTGLEEAAIFAIGRFVLPDFNIRLPLLPLILIMLAWAAFSTWLFIFTSRTLKRKAQAGLPSMTGIRGTAANALNPEGLVQIRGELWGAVSEGGNIAAGEEIIVVAENGLKLTVRKIDSGDIKR